MPKPSSKLIEDPGPILDPGGPGGRPELIKIASKVEYDLDEYDGQETGELGEVLSALSEFGGEALVFKLDAPNERANGQAFENVKIKYDTPEDFDETRIDELQSLADDLGALLLPAVQSADVAAAGLKIYHKVEYLGDDDPAEPQTLNMPPDDLV